MTKNNSFEFLLRRVAFGWKESLNSDSRVYIYCNRTFCGWDYCINDQKAAELKHNNIKNEIKVTK